MASLLLHNNSNPATAVIAIVLSLRKPTTQWHYRSTWASLIEVYRHKAQNGAPIESVVFPAMGAGFGGVPYTEVARQMAAAYRHYLNPPHRMDWDMVANRQRTIHYDGNRQVSR